MSEQRFTHENEILAMAPLNSEKDSKLFAKQSVRLTPAGDIQWILSCMMTVTGISGRKHFTS